jgi:D-tyrosyl-tRNA(Tyr) deacylase
MALAPADGADDENKDAAWGRRNGFGRNPVRALIQRVSEARVSIDGEVIAAIDGGVLVLVCAMHGDSDEAAQLLARKTANLRIFEDDDGKMNRSVLDAGGAALVVSQFTLAADTSRGNRPGFSRAAAPEEGRRLYERFGRLLAELGVPTQSGRFGAHMSVHLINHGPVTIWLDTDTR